jgi:hypothetical protein
VVSLERVISDWFAGAGLIAAALLTAGCNSPARTIRPVIYAHPEDKYQAMRSAPVILIAEVLDFKLVSEARNVEKPSEVGGPEAPRIPLHLARISADVILTLRGNERSPVEFYSWVWASGKHGGPRLFRFYPGYYHILFLREEGGYLHTVGDYPAYDLEIPRGWLPAIVSGLKSGQESGSDLFERIATVRLRTELESMRTIRRNYWPEDMLDLAGLTSPFYIASRLDSFCRQLANPFGRFAACAVIAREFNGRCDAYRLAREADSTGVEAAYVAQALAECEAREEYTIDFLRARNWPLRVFGYGWRQTAERHRAAMRLFASAMDPKFRAAACGAAAKMPEARDIPECATSGAPSSVPAAARVPGSPSR